MKRLQPPCGRRRFACGFFLAIPLAWATFVGCEQEPSTTTAAADRPQAELLRKAVTLIEQQESFKLAVKVEMEMEFQGRKQEMKSDYSLAVARPDRLAMRPLPPVAEEGKEDAGDGDGVILVTDGKQFWRAIPALKKYVVGDAPESLSKVFSDRVAVFLGLGIGGSFFDSLLSDQAYDRLMAGVTDSADLGVEKIADKDCQHLQFQQGDYDWDIWIETGAKPTIRKVSFRIKKFPGLSAREVPDVKMAVVYEMRDWEFDPKFSDQEFAFDPPADWEKVDNMLGGQANEQAEAPNPLLGKPAPDFELEKLDGGKMQLATYKDKEVVILDFWATWCGPCVKALPIISEVAAKYRDRGVAFYAVDLGEGPDEVKKFLKEQQLDIPVILDRENEVGKLYGANAIPQTVLIGKDGTVQVVHVGLLPDLEKRLSGELDDLLAGKDLAAAKLESFKAAQGDAAGMQLAWSHDGAWSGVTPAPGEGAVFALGAAGKVIKMSAKGEELAAADLAGSPKLVRAANLVGSQEAELLTFTVWGPSVSAQSADGTPLWSYGEGQGVDDVWAADLNGDGLDEVIIGYNGGSGLHVLDNAGKLLWKNAEISNVWHVTAGNVDEGAGPEVITTSAAGQVHIFDAAGKQLRDIDPGIYGNMIRVCAGQDDQSLDRLVVAGQGKPKDTVVLLDAAGKQLWSLEVAANVGSAAACQGKPWLAIALADGNVRVIDVDSGQEFAHAAGQGERAQVAWLPTAGDTPPLLVVATDRGLNAFEISAEKR